MLTPKSSPQVRARDTSPLAVEAGEGFPRRRFPANTGRDLVLLLTFILFIGLVYSITIRHPLRPPRLLPMLPFETAIPTLPWTGWVYLSYYPLLLYAGGRMLGRPWFLRGLAACVAVTVISGLVFLFWPTTIAQEEIAAGVPFASLLVFIRAHDSPNGCFPSLHVGMAILATLFAWRVRRSEGIVLAVWAAAVIVSTLTTRQHYSLDAVGGAVVALLCYAAAFRLGRWRAGETG